MVIAHRAIKLAAVGSKTGNLELQPYDQIVLFRYIKVHMATRWTIRHGFMLLRFKDLMNVTKEVTTYRPNVSTLLPSAFIRGDLNAATYYTSDEEYSFCASFDVLV